jgi:hypothetical protein
MLLNILAGAVVLWILFYFLIYVVFLSPNNKTSSTNTNIVQSTTAARGDGLVGRDLKAMLKQDPFTSSECKARNYTLSPADTVGVVIVARNEPKLDLLNTVKKILNKPI